jgi:tol-pal system protein YbgF
LRAALLTGLFILLFPGCDLRKNTPPPSSVDVPGSEVSEARLGTQIVSLNKRYENLDSRVAENRQTLEALKKELSSLRHSVGILGPVNRPSTVEQPSNLRSYKETKKESLPLASSPQDARTLYDNALKAYSKANYPTAISRFEEFLKAFPSSDLADNAFYWIGESYYGKEDFERAIASFLKVLDRYPNGNKVPDALFKIGLSYIQLNDAQRAREFLTRVMDNYPFSDAARHAKTSLDRLD